MGGWQQAAQLGWLQVAPAAGFQSIKPDVDNPYSLQAVYPVSKHLAHAPDLAIEPLGKNNTESPGADAAGPATPGGDIQLRQPHATTHPGQNRVRDRPIHCNYIFLLVLVLGAQDLVDNITVAGEQYQALRFLVQAADGEDACFMFYKINDVSGHVTVGGAGDTGWFVQGDINVVFPADRDGAPVDAHLIGFAYLRPQVSAAAVDGHAAPFDPRIRFAP